MPTVAAEPPHSPTAGPGTGGEGRFSGGPPVPPAGLASPGRPPPSHRGASGQQLAHRLRGGCRLPDGTGREGSQARGAPGAPPLQPPRYLPLW